MISELAKKLYGILTYDYQSREVLCAKMSSSDREVRDRQLRDIFKELKDQGYPVFSSSHTKGYKRATPQEVEMLAREYEKRGVSCFRTAGNLRKGLDLGQMEVEI